ncbi:hypothetical protein QBC39DRAFT_404306 [Podospora conica]|nr:hypothetical protein QBC39DRAFT_404306 [Schizothecium conicum]
MIPQSFLLNLVVLAGFTTALSIQPSTCGTTCSDALGVLLGRCRPLPPTCVDEVAVNARAFCSSFLSTVTVVQTTTVRTTATALQSVTDTATTTTTSTERSTETITTATTATDTATETSTSLSTYTTTATIAVMRRGARPTACPELSTPRLHRLAPAKVSSLCSLLGVSAPSAATTATHTSTATAASTTTASTETATVATTTTAITLETTTVPTTTTATTTTTTSAVATATAIQAFDPCHASQSYQGTVGGAWGSGNAIIIEVGSPSAYDCCKRCWAKSNCQVTAYTGSGTCELLMKVSPLAGARTKAQCPLGISPYVRAGTGQGYFLDGPCAARV